jgi:hypothetical protein
MHTLLGQVHGNLFHGSYNSTPATTLCLSEALNWIQSGIYRQDIERLRALLATHGKHAYDLQKKSLDAFTFCGTFHPRRGKEHLTQHSHIAHFDYDNIGDVAKAKEVLCVGGGVCYVFDSPSGGGLKAGVHIPLVASDAAYKHAWQCVADHIAQHTGFVADRSGKDISRLCYLSWDPECFINLHASVFPVPPAPALHITTRNKVGMMGPPPTSAGDRRQQYLQQAIARATHLIATSQPAPPHGAGTRHLHRLRAGRLLGGYVGGGFLSYDEAYQILGTVVRQHTVHYERSMQTIAAALVFGIRSPVTFEQLEQERLAWCARRGYTPRREEPR